MKIKILLSVIAFGFLISPFKGRSQACNVQDSLALAQFADSNYYSNSYYTGNAFGWNLTNPVKTWNGVTVLLGRVVTLNVIAAEGTNFNLTSSLGNLPFLSQLTVDNSTVVGYPNGVGSASVYYLTGSIPYSLGNLTNLTVLSLSGVSLYNGTFAYDNVINLTGSIPSSLGNLTNLTTLSLSGNELTGTIPSSLGSLINLTTLDLSLNQLTGSIPSSLGNLINLTTLNLIVNQLSGSIPSSLGNLTNLTTLNLEFNQLTQSIPSTLGKLANLENLSLGNSKSFQQYQYAGVGQLFENQLSGSIPSTLGNLTNLTTLDLSYNQLSGSIPSTLGKLANLTTLDLSYNQLSDSIPSTLGNLTLLTTLDLSYNQLSGNIPSQLSQLGIASVGVNSDLFLYFNNNKLSGLVPFFQNVNTCNISYNNYDFSGLETFSVSPAYNVNATLTDLPQATIPLIQNGSQLIFSVGGTPANITYKLFLNGSLLKNQLADSVFTITRTGIYDAIAVDTMSAFGYRYQVGTLYSDTIIVSSILPLNLLSFTGTMQHNTAQLNWQTTDEINTQSFNLERSADGINFIPLASMSATDAPGTNNYSYTDTKPLEGDNYYRLKMYDKDDDFTYSRIIKLNNGGGAFAIQVYPNPAAASATVAFNSLTAGKYSVTVDGMDGKTVKRIEGVAATGANGLQLDISGLAAGVYMVTFNSADGTHTVKLVKQ